MVFQLCRTYQALPEVGGILDQDVELLRRHTILSLGGYFDEKGEGGGPPPGPAFSGGPTPPRSPLESLPMELVGAF